MGDSCDSFQDIVLRAAEVSISSPVPRYQRKTRAGLAKALRDVVSDEWIAGFLLGVISGEDPCARRSKLGTKLAGGVQTPPDWTTRMKALKMFLERRDGMPMQAIHVEQEIRAAGHVQVDISAATLRQADPEKKAQLRELLREVVQGAPSPVRNVITAAKAANPIAK